MKTLSHSFRAALVSVVAVLSFAPVAHAGIAGFAGITAAVTAPASLPASKAVHRRHGAAQDAVTAGVAARDAARTPQHRIGRAHLRGAAHRHHHHMLHHTARMIDGGGGDTRLPLPGRPSVPRRTEHLATVPHAPNFNRASTHGRPIHPQALSAVAPGCAAPCAVRRAVPCGAIVPASTVCTLSQGRAPPDATRMLRCASSSRAAGLRISFQPAVSSLSRALMSSLTPFTRTDAGVPASACPL